MRFTAQPGAETRGIVYARLNIGDLRRLDAYEGCDYQRVRVVVRLQDGRELSAWTYLTRPAARRTLSSDAWSLEVFTQNELKAYLARLDKG